MKPSLPQPALARARRAALTLLLVGLSLPAAALYKVVGPDGRVTYTDRPPGDSGARVSTLNREAGNEVVSPQDILPYELRQAAARYPVTLYTSADCAPCDAGRQLLVQRGVPFSEKRIVTDDDAAALDRVIGGRTVPSLTIGAQALRGLSSIEWNAYLDAAGYPRESRLPRGWQQSAATALVQRGNPHSAPAPASAPQAAPPAPAPSEPSVVSPPGLRF
jgi:glutaredoxin